MRVWMWQPVRVTRTYLQEMESLEKGVVLGKAAVRASTVRRWGKQGTERTMRKMEITGRQQI